MEVKGRNLPSRIQVQNQLEQQEQAQKNRPHFLTVEPNQADSDVRDS